MKKILAVLPFRLQSTRVPEKILHKIAGEELCLRTVKRTLLTQFSELTVIAAVDNEKTKAVLARALPETQIILTDPALPSGTDRVYTAAKIFAAQNAAALSNLQAIVNVQGDMPFLSARALEKFMLEVMSLDPARDRILTPYEPWPTDMDPRDLGHVKIACDASGRALYFSRFPIPCSRQMDPAALKLHVGIYAYTPNALERFCRAGPSQLEQLEGLEQLRALSMGIPIQCVQVESGAGESFRGVDTPGDIAWAERFASAAP